MSALGRGSGSPALHIVTLPPPPMVNVHSDYSRRPYVVNRYPALYIISCVGMKNDKVKIVYRFSAIKLCFAVNVLNNKKFILLNLAKYPLILANSAAIFSATSRDNCYFMQWERSGTDKSFIRVVGAFGWDMGLPFFWCVSSVTTVNRQRQKMLWGLKTTAKNMYYQGCLNQSCSQRLRSFWSAPKLLIQVGTLYMGT